MKEHSLYHLSSFSVWTTLHSHKFHHFSNEKSRELENYNINFLDINDGWFWYLHNLNFTLTSFNFGCLNISTLRWNSTRSSKRVAREVFINIKEVINCQFSQSHWVLVTQNDKTRWATTNISQTAKVKKRHFFKNSIISLHLFFFSNSVI